MKLKTVNRKLEIISNARLATGFAILICWFYPVVFSAGVAFLYPISVLFLALFVYFVYQSTRLNEFKAYLIQREVMSERKMCQAKAEYKYTANELNRWNDLVAKLNFDKSPHWDDLDILKQNGLLQAVHFTGNSSSLSYLMLLMMRSELTAEKIKERQAKVKFFLQGPRRKTLALLSLHKQLNHSVSTHDLLKEPLMEKSNWLYAVYAYYGILWITYLLYLFSGFTAFGLFLFGLFFVIPIASNQIKIFKTYGWVSGFEAQLARMQSVQKSIRIYAKLAKEKNIPVMSSFQETPNGLSFEKTIKELNRIIGAMGVRQNFILYGIVHAFLPWDFYWTARAEVIRKKLLNVYLGWVTDLVELEACSLLAEYSTNVSGGVWPKIVSEPGFLKVRALKHPLISAASVVENDADLNLENRKCLLITGSNMSGKSTFLRTLGINLILMRSGAKVLASDFETSAFQVLTSLKRVDSLEESLSTFYSEVKTLKEIRDESVSHTSLYLIDEIFRGTNNRERLIGAQKYIKGLLQSPSVGLVTTHDLELAQMDQEYKNLVNEHFADKIENGKMIFDYKKKSGPCPSTNALKVMEMEGVI